MADFPAVVFGPAPSLGETLDSHPAFLVEVGGGAATVKYYLMEANDSVNDLPYGWVASGAPDWAGAGYPGPNAPVGIRISGEHPC